MTTPKTPFVQYLEMRPDRPQGIPHRLRMPATEWCLYQLSGYSYGYHNTWNPDNYANSPPAKHLPPQGYFRWQVWARTWPVLREWVESDDCWIPPDHWPPEVAEYMPAHVTPLAFAVGVLPDKRNDRRSALLYNLDPTVQAGLAALGAYSVGFPLRPEDYPRMRLAAERLQEEVPFLLWAYNPNLAVVPLPEHKDFFRANAVRSRLEEDPLVASKFILSHALEPEHQTLEFLLGLPQLPFDPLRSSKTACLAMYAYIWEKGRRRDWIRFNWDGWG